MDSDRKICVGRIAGSHGVRGLIRLHSFTEDPESIGTFGPFTDETGEQTFHVTIKSAVKDQFVAEVKGVASKEAADVLKGTMLYVPRSALPKISKKEYYEADLIGLKAHDTAKKSYGKVMAVHNYGAGPFLEIGTNKKDSFMLPFTKECVPEVDMKAGTVTIDPPAGWP